MRWWGIIKTFAAKPLPKPHIPFPLNFIPQPFKVTLLLSAFLVNLNVPTKQYYNVKLLIRLSGELFNSYTMYKFKMKLLYKEKELFYTKTELLYLKITLSLANGIFFSDDILVGTK